MSNQVRYAFGQGNLAGKALQLGGWARPPVGFEVIEPIDNPEAVYVHQKAHQALAEEDQRMIARIDKKLEEIDAEEGSQGDANRDSNGRR